MRPSVHLFWLLLMPALAGAQTHPLVRRVVLSGENPQVANQLHGVDRQAALLLANMNAAEILGAENPLFALALEHGTADQWTQILADYQQLIQESGDVLVPMRPIGSPEAVPPPSVQVRRLCQQRIAELPERVRGLYRDRVNARARQLLQEGREQRSAAPLRRLVEEYYASGLTDQALDLLGDLAFEQGDFEGARAWWRQLIRPPSESVSPLLLLPESTLEAARLHAKQVLAYAFQDQLDRARLEFKAFRRLHADAQGALAGKDGPYDATLAGWIDVLTKKLPERGQASNQEPWTTFGGNAARNRVLALCPSTRLWADGATWRVRLPLGPEPLAEPGLVPKTGPPARLAFHPLIVADQVLIADPRTVTAYDLRTGKERFKLTLESALPKEPEDFKLAEGRYTLTAEGTRVFARLGRQSLQPRGPGDKKDQGHSYLMCIDLAGASPGKPVWQITATGPDGEPGFFEGAPLVENGRVFAAVSRAVGHKTLTALACYDAETGKPRWWQETIFTPEFEDASEPRFRQHLLTLGGSRLYYCGHAGAVVAVDPWTGQHLWGMRYFSRGPKTAEGAVSPRDLSPAIYADGRLYLAPLDADRLLCLDAATGRLLWEQEAIEVVHLFGVTRGRVYFTTTRGLQCLDAHTGLSQGGWLQPAEGRLPPLGRGVIAGSWLFWPTQDPKLPLRGVTVDEGHQERTPSEQAAAEPDYLEPTMLRNIPPGNMAFGQGSLAIAGLEELVVYVAPRHFLKEREDNLRDARDEPRSLYLLAQAQADAGMGKEAQANLRKLGDAANEDWGPLARARLLEWFGKGTRDPRLSDLLRTRAPLPGPSFVMEQPPTILAFPVHKVRTVREALVPMDGAGSEFYTRHDGRLSCWGSGERRWSEESAGPVTWARRYGHLLLANGPEGLLALDAKTGRPVWSFPNPAPVVYSLAETEPTVTRGDGDLTDFRANDRLLFCLFDQRLLLALSPSSGQVVWQRWAPGGELQTLDEAARFSSHYHAGDRFVLLQTGGKRLSLDSRTGQVLHEATAPAPWPQSPFALGDGRLVLAEEAGRTLLLDVVTNKTLWRHEPPGYTSLTGAPARVFGDNQKLLALVPRNLGIELVRLDAAKGTRLWSVPALPEVSDLQLDTDSVYLLHQNVLEARWLQDGKRRWKQTLPFVGKRIIRNGPALLVVPRDEISVPLLDVEAPSPRKLLSERSVLVLDPATGQWLQRLPLTATSGTVHVQFAPGRLLIGTGSQTMVYEPLFP